MNPLLRRVLIGIPVGLLAGIALVTTLGHPFLSLILGAVVGACYSASLDPTRDTYVDNLMGAAALGVPLWGLVTVIGIPVLSGHQPEWNAEQMRSQFPALIGWVIFGAALGLLRQGLNDTVAGISGRGCFTIRRPVVKNWSRVCKPARPKAPIIPFLGSP